MRFSEPSIRAGLSALAERGVRHVAAIVLSPQYSPLLMSGYNRAIEEARAAMGDAAPEVRVAGAWHHEPAFVSALAHRVVEALDRLPADERHAVAVLMTAHSLPRRVADQEPEYLDQLRATAEAVAAKAAGLMGSGVVVLLAERGSRARRVDEAGLRRPHARDRAPQAGARSWWSRSSSWPTTSRSCTTSTSARASRPSGPA